MSEAAAKATRRQLRRAIGDVAGAALTEQSQLTTKHDRLIALQSERLSTLQTSLRQLDAELKQQSSSAHAFVSMTFGQRLRWLITGTLDGR